MKVSGNSPQQSQQDGIPAQAWCFEQIQHGMGGFLGASPARFLGCNLWEKRDFQISSCSKFKINNILYLCS